MKKQLSLPQKKIEQYLKVLDNTFHKNIAMPFIGNENFINNSTDTKLDNNGKIKYCLNFVAHGRIKFDFEVKGLNLVIDKNNTKTCNYTFSGKLVTDGILYESHTSSYPALGALKKLDMSILPTCVITNDIFDKLNLNALGNLSQVSSQYNKLVNNNAFWKKKLNDFPGFHNSLATDKSYEYKDLFKMLKKSNLTHQNINLQEKGITPIHLAINFQYREIFNYLINLKNINLSLTDKYGLTPLNLAVCKGNLEFVKKIVEKDEGKSLNLADKKKATPLLNATRLGSPKIAAYLLQQENITHKINNQWLGGKDYNQLNSEYGFTALHFAAKNGHSKLLKALLDKGAKLNSKNFHECNPEFYAATNEIEAFLKLNGYLQFIDKFKESTTTRKCTFFEKTPRCSGKQSYLAATALKKYLISLFNKTDDLEKNKQALKEHKIPLNSRSLGEIYKLCKPGLKEGKEIPQDHGRYYQHTPPKDTLISEFRNN